MDDDELDFIINDRKAWYTTSNAEVIVWLGILAVMVISLFVASFTA